MKLLVIDIQKGITDSRLFNFDEFIDNTSWDGINLSSPVRAFL